MSHEKTLSQTTLSEYFSHGIMRESKDLLPPLSEGVIHYLTHVLVRYSESRRLFHMENGVRSLPTLALLYRDARQAKSRHEGNIILRQLGDSALFLGALFFEYYDNKGISKDYFIGMGGAAYSTLGDHHYGDTEVFYELADKFPKLLQVLANVCSIELNYYSEDIITLLGRWQHSKDDVIRKQLLSIGIVPFELNKH